MKGLQVFGRLLWKLFQFPRPDLENRWWHRMFKVATFLSVIFIFFKLSLWANEVFRPYYVYSFESNFSTYSGKIKKFSEIDDSLHNDVRLVVAFRYSAGPAASKYVEDMEHSGKSDYFIAQQMRKDGLLEGVTVKDLQTDFASPHQKTALTLFLTVLSYLAIIHLLYRVIAYIIAGRPNPT